MIGALFGVAIVIDSTGRGTGSHWVEREEKRTQLVFISCFSFLVHGTPSLGWGKGVSANQYVLLFTNQMPIIQGGKFCRLPLVAGVEVTLTGGANEAISCPIQRNRQEEGDRWQMHWPGKSLSA